MYPLLTANSTDGADNASRSGGNVSRLFLNHYCPNKQNFKISIILIYKLNSLLVFLIDKVLTGQLNI